MARRAVAKKTRINFRIEETLKEQMEQVCRGMGINMTTAFDLFCRRVVMENGLPFEIEPREKKGGQENV